MSQEPNRYPRDMTGYGANTPDPKWPGGARIALNFVINVEEGSEPSVQDGEGYLEVQLTDAFGRPPLPDRDLAGESMFEYGSRVESAGDGAFVIEYTDDIGHAGERLVHRCHQRITLDDAERIRRIEHVDLPGETEAVDAFLARVGIEREG